MAGKFTKSQPSSQEYRFRIAMKRYAAENVLLRELALCPAGNPILPLLSTMAFVASSPPFHNEHHIREGTSCKGARRNCYSSLHMSPHPVYTIVSPRSSKKSTLNRYNKTQLDAHVPALFTTWIAVIQYKLHVQQEFITVYSEIAWSYRASPHEGQAASFGSTPILEQHRKVSSSICPFGE